ncbi:MAG TPA: hypothetical protein DIT64_04275 [Verrucomicrobiales bacterium]|nr:hypothetical protein [Verrucomicrobiales bacterium]
MRLLPCLPLFFSTIHSAEVAVANVDELNAALRQARPGDTLVLAEGEWRDAVIRCNAQGTESMPVTLRAAVPGKTVLTGQSALRLGGRHVVVEGLWFRNPDPAAGDTVEFRLDSKNLARHCRVTNCAITMDAGQSARDDKESRWVGIYGGHNRLDHCLIEGKVTKGASVVVWLGEGQEAAHMLDHNHFGPRERLGKNGGETLRVGDSKTSMSAASCIVEDNLFERCNGEAECVSNKSCGNTYRRNFFLEVSGTLTLRHGNACLVEANTFLGNGANGTGGVRIIGEDHVVRGNHFEKLAGDDARCAIVIMQGVPGSALNEYFQVKRARVESNTLLDCEHPILIGLKDGRGSLPPLDCSFTSNRVLAPKSAVVEARCDISGVRWQGNVFHGKAPGISVSEGIEWQPPSIAPVGEPERRGYGPAWRR